MHVTWWNSTPVFWTCASYTDKSGVVDCRQPAWWEWFVEQTRFCISLPLLRAARRHRWSSTSPFGWTSWHAGSSDQHWTLPLSCTHCPHTRGAKMISGDKRDAPRTRFGSLVNYDATPLYKLTIDWILAGMCGERQQWDRLDLKRLIKVAQLSQRDRTTGWVSYGQRWKTRTGRQYFTDTIGLYSSTDVIGQ